MALGGLELGLGLVPMKTTAERVLDEAIALNDVPNGMTFTRATSAWDPYFNQIVAPGVRRRRPASIGRFRAFGLDLIEGSATNLLAAGSSDNFTNSAWSAITATVSASGVDFAGETAYLISGIGSGQRIVQSSIVVSATSVTWSTHVKAGTNAGATLLLYDNTGSATVGSATYNLTTGVATGTGSGMVSVGGGWYRIWQSYTVTSGHSFTAYLYTDSSQGAGTAGSIYASKAQVEQSAFPTSYVSNRNLLTHSGDFTQSAWTKTANATVTANAIADPISGLVTAAAITESTTTIGTHGVFQSGSKAGSSLAMVGTFYAQQGQRSQCLVQIANGPYTSGAQVYVNLVTGAIITSGTFGSGFSLGTISVTAVGSWWKISVPVTTDNSMGVIAAINSAVAGGSAYAGTVGYNAIYAADPQLEYGTAPSAYWGTDSAPGVRDADNLSVSLAGLPGGGLSTTAGTVTGLVIPYGWSGNTGANARLCDDSTTTGVTTLLINSSGVSAGARKDTVGVQTSNGPSGTPSSLTLQHETLTYGASSCLTYRNAVAGTSQSATPPWAASTGLQVGAKQGAAAEFLYGWTCLLYHARVLALAEIQALYVALPALS